MMAFDLGDAIDVARLERRLHRALVERLLTVREPELVVRAARGAHVGPPSGVRVLPDAALGLSVAERELVEELLMKVANSSDEKTAQRAADEVWTLLDGKRRALRVGSR
jgi:hypothetical protein